MMIVPHLDPEFEFVQIKSSDTRIEKLSNEEETGPKNFSCCQSFTFVLILFSEFSPSSVVRPSKNLKNDLSDTNLRYRRILLS